MIVFSVNSKTLNWKEEFRKKRKRYLALLKTCKWVEENLIWGSFPRSFIKLFCWASSEEEPCWSLRESKWKRPCSLESSTFHQSFPGGSDSKESACNGGRPEFNPWVGKIPWRREGLPTPIFVPREFHGQRSQAGYSPMCHKEQTQLSDFHSPWLYCSVLPIVLLSLLLHSVGWTLTAHMTTGIPLKIHWMGNNILKSDAKKVLQLI